jgi:hypothetical protein
MPFFSKKELNRALYFLRFKIPFFFPSEEFKSSSFEYSNFKTYFGKYGKDGLILVKSLSKMLQKGSDFFPPRRQEILNNSWQHLLYR